MMRVAVLDDYQRAALGLADWQSLHPAAQIEAFPEHWADPAEVAKRLHVYEAVVLMRERTPFPRALIEQLPNLRLIVTAGMHNASIDVAAAASRGITVCGTEMLGYPTAELAWGLILSLARKIPQEFASLRLGHWQSTLGTGLKGKVLGIVGLGRLGSQMAKIGHAFGMSIIAWSQNLTPEQAQEAGADYVSKEDLFSKADIVSIHVVLSDRSCGLVGAKELGLMKKTAYLVNTARGPIVDEKALIAALNSKSIAGAGLDVFDVEPLPLDHPFRKMDNVVLTPHLGYVSERNYRVLYSGVVEDIRAWLDGKPVRLLEAKY